MDRMMLSGLSLCLQVIILIGNKADLEAQRDVTYEEAKQFAEENGEADRAAPVVQTGSGCLTWILSTCITSACLPSHCNSMIKGLFWFYY